MRAASPLKPDVRAQWMPALGEDGICRGMDPPAPGLPPSPRLLRTNRQAGSRARREPRFALPPRPPPAVTDVFPDWSQTPDL